MVCLGIVVDAVDRVAVDAACASPAGPTAVVVPYLPVPPEVPSAPISPPAALLNQMGLIPWIPFWELCLPGSRHASGGFGDVYSGFWMKPEGNTRLIPIPIAAKASRKKPGTIRAQGKAQKMKAKELEMLQELRGVEYIVHLHGVSKSPRHGDLLVMEWMSGSLHDLLHGQSPRKDSAVASAASSSSMQGQTAVPVRGPPGASLSILQRVRLAKQFALGVAHLHNLPIVHRDIKSPNVLVSQLGDIWKVKLC
jgi:serine/threonine protein kinase